MRFKNKRPELPSRHPEKPKATKDLLRSEGERPRSKPLRAAAEEILRFAQNDEGRKRPRGLVASLLAVALALCLLLGTAVAGAATGAGEAQETSAGGSVVGILIDNSPAKEDVDSGKYTGNDSYLGLLLDAEVAKEVTVTFMLADARPYTSLTIPFGSKAAPPNDPVWEASWGSCPGVTGTPVFDRWCADKACTTAYDFSTAVTEDTTIWAAWAEGEKVDVTLDANGGTVVDPDDPLATPQPAITLKYFPGALYRSLPVPQKTGYTFQCWETSEGAAVDPAADTVPAEGIALSARWKANTYWVHYHLNGGQGTAQDQQLTYDTPATALGWEAASGNGSKPYRKDFDGWNTRRDGSGTYYGADATLLNLTAAPNGWVTLYAQWKDEFTVEDGPFEVRFMTNDGTGTGGAGQVWREFTKAAGTAVEKDGYVAKEQVPDPKRTGYRFSCWRMGTAGEGGSVTLGSEWTFDEQVRSDLTLYAEWILRMDVTVPVEVGFAVDADSRKVTTPDAGRYAIKSRTVEEVQVDEMAVVSPDSELQGFFELPEGSASSWEDALNKTELWVWRVDAGLTGPDTSVRPSGPGALALPLVSAGREEGEYIKRHDDGTEETISGWRNAQSLKNDAAFRLGAFDYARAGAAFDESWQGEDPSERIPLKLGLSIPDLLEVRTDLDGAKPVTHLIVTVSARG